MELQPVIRAGLKVKRFFEKHFSIDVSTKEAQIKESQIENIKRRIHDDLEEGGDDENGRIFDTVNRISEKTKRLTDSLQVDIRTLDYKVSNIENLVLRISDDLKTIKDTMGNGAEVSK